jgi:hypothetical protein
VEQIWIHHPDLPDAGPVKVAKSSLRIHANAGWVEVPADTGEGGVPAEPDHVAPENKTPRRSSRIKDETPEDGS